MGNNIIKKNEWDKQQPLVSIVIPTYNRANRVVQTLDSIFAQTYSYFEVIVVDDGSTDNTIQVLEEYKQQTPRKEIAFTIVRQANAGAPVARNKGLSMAKGEYIVFFDSDDLMHKSRIEKQTKCILENKADCCACGFSINTYDGYTFIPVLPPSITPIRALVTGKILGSNQMWMFKTSLVNQINGWDETMPCHQDGELISRVLMQTSNIAILPESLSLFITHSETRISNTVKKDTRKGLDAFLKFHLNVLFKIASIHDSPTYFAEIKSLSSFIPLYSASKKCKDIIGVLKKIYQAGKHISIFIAITGAIFFLCMSLYRGINNTFVAKNRNV
jgi:glycosyltransferase involved in cell wall biosynthesis